MRFAHSASWAFSEVTFIAPSQSVLRWPLDMIDDEYVQQSLCRLKSQPKLLLQSRQKPQSTRDNPTITIHCRDVILACIARPYTWNLPSLLPLEQFTISYRDVNGSLNHAVASFWVMVGSSCATV